MLIGGLRVHRGAEADSRREDDGANRRTGKHDMTLQDR